MKINNRIYWMDSVRVLAIFLVILIHSPLPSDESNIFLSVYNYISATSIGLLFMISGALLLSSKNIKIETFYTKRLLKIGIPLLFWSIFYILIHNTEEPTMINIITTIFKTIFKPAEGVLWFLYTLISLYLITPLITPWLHTATKNNIKLILFFFIITLTFPYLNIFIPEIYHTQPTNSTAISFVNPLFYFQGYVGYFLLGYYLYTYSIKLNLLKILFFIFLIIIICAVIPGFIYFNDDLNFNNSILYGYLTPNVAILSVAIFLFFQKVIISNNYYNLFISELSKMSFGIYLVHIFILRDLIWNIFGNHYIIDISIQIPLMALISFFLSYVVIKFITYIPNSKYIIGN